MCAPMCVVARNGSLESARLLTGRICSFVKEGQGGISSDQKTP
jgi:hypothetical protein